MQIEYLTSILTVPYPNRIRTIHPDGSEIHRIRRTYRIGFAVPPDPWTVSGGDICMSFEACQYRWRAREISISGHLQSMQGNPDIGNPDIRISGYPNIRISGYPDIRISGYPDIRISGYPDIRIFGYPDIRISGFPISGFPCIDCRCPDILISLARHRYWQASKDMQISPPDTVHGSGGTANPIR